MSPTRPRSPEALVVGDILADLAVAIRGPIAWDSDTEAEVRLAGGGAAANFAVQLAALGVSTILAGVVGDDALGAIQVADLAARGVRVRVRRRPRTGTGVVIALVRRDGRRSMLTSRGASAQLRPEDLPRSLFARGRHLHLSGYVLLGRSSRAAGLAALARARELGMTISVDASSHGPLGTLGGARFRRLTGGAAVLFCNQAEALALSGAGSWRGALGTLAAEYPEVVLKRGRLGAVWASGRTRIALPSAGSGARDTTGAGDAFDAAWLAGWLRGREREPLLRQALERAALAVTWAGGRPLDPRAWRRAPPGAGGIIRAS